MNRFIVAFEKLENAFIATGLLATVIFTFANVVMRYFFQTGTSWSEELVRYLMIWVTFVGVSVGIRTKSHVAVDFFVGLLKKTRFQYVIIFFGNLVNFLFCAAVFYSSILLTVKVYNQGQLTAGLQLPMWIFYVLIPLSSGAASVRYLFEIYINITNPSKLSMSESL